MEKLSNALTAASKDYNLGRDHTKHCKDAILIAHRMLFANSKFQHFGNLRTAPGTEYYSFFDNGAISRPIRPDLYVSDEQHLLKMLDEAFTPDLLSPAHLNYLIYTSVMSVASCFDLWKPGSRKTPGTFFEIFIASLVKRLLPNAQLSKHISLTNDAHANLFAPNAPEAENSTRISTDLVVTNPNNRKSVVLALKITTRERIVQPYAHQRILEAAFPPGQYRSLIVCISETQQEKTLQAVNHICTPGPIKLYQRHLATVSGLLYCDIPTRYLAQDVTDCIPILDNGNLISYLKHLLDT